MPDLRTGLQGPQTAASAAEAPRRSEARPRWIARPEDTGLAIRRSALQPLPDAPRSLAEGSTEAFVEDAGVVILAPFLPAYLAKLGLVRERAFVSPETRERAVLLLRYLATNKSDLSDGSDLSDLSDGSDTSDGLAASPGGNVFAAGEQHLVLDKLLCGWPLAEPVKRAIELSSAEEEESRELLASVVHHWKALGRTSAEGLRASFLSREGRLSATAEGWKLEVARTGFDVLLDQLPWGIGLVRLPWMDRPLFVEW